MGLSLSPSMTVRDFLWTEFKNILSNKIGVVQYDASNANIYQIWFYDGPEIITCQIYRVVVPDAVITNGYSQAQNDSDKTDFELNYKPYANGPTVPKSSDGRINQLPTLFPSAVTVYFPGAGDSANVIGAGPKFSIQQALLGVSGAVTWNFKDYIYISGGTVNYQNGQYGDYIDYLLQAPATTYSSTPGAGTADLVNAQFIPNLTNTGGVTITAGVPVPAPNYDGYYDWLAPNSGLGAGTIVVNNNYLLGQAPAGKYNLYSVAVPLSHFLLTVPVLGSGQMNFNVPAILPKKCLPQWQHVVKINNVDGLHTLNVSWVLYAARAKTT